MSDPTPPPSAPGDHDPTVTAGDLVQPPTLAAPAGQPGPQEAVPPADGAARYRILRAHARGGLGEVFLARDEELSREVALKEMHAEFAQDGASRARFLLEAEVTAALEHPGVVPVHGLGRHGDGRPFYAMRFIQGDTLSDAIDRFHAERPQRTAGENRLALRALLMRFVAVCNTVAYAHSKGILHRDLKPGNILLGKYGETLLVDWGLARRRDEGRGMRDEEKSSTPLSSLIPPPSSLPTKPAAPRDRGPDMTELTEHGQVLGTPAYMSPEQAEGHLDRLGPAADIYSLGATLYHLLTGRPPIAGAGVAEMLTRARRGDFPPPRRVRADVPLALQAICLRAMALRPEERYATALELAADVEHWLADEPVRAYPESPAARLGRWARRHRALVAAAAALLMTAVVALSVSTVLIGLQQAETEDARRQAEANAREAHVQEQRARTQQALAEEQRQQAELNFRKAQDAVDEMLTEVGQTWLADVPLMDPVRRTLLEKALTFYQGFLKEKSTDRATRYRTAWAHLRLAKVHNLLGHEKQAEQAFLDGERLLQRLLDDFPEDEVYRQDLAGVHNDLGILHKNAGRLAVAEGFYARALAVQQKLVADAQASRYHRLALASTLHNFANVLQQAGRVPQARQGHEQALALRERLVGESPNDPVSRADLAKTHNALATLLGRVGEVERAQNAFHQAVALHRKLADEFPNKPAYRHALAGSLNNQGVLLETLGRPADAVAAFRQALAISQKLVEEFPTRPDYRSYLVNHLTGVGRQEARLGRPKEAEHSYRQALTVSQKLTEDCPTNPEYRLQLARNQANLARLHRDAAQLSRAREIALQTLALREKLVNDFPDRPEYRRALAFGYREVAVLCDAQEHATAKEHYLKGLAIRAKLVADFPQVAEYRHDLAVDSRNLGVLHAGMGEDEEAKHAYLRAQALWHKLTEEVPGYPEYRYYLALTHYNLGNLLGKVGGPGERETAYRQAMPLQHRLAEEFPEVSKYRSAYGATLNNLGLCLAERGALPEARQVYELAIVHQRAARKVNPTDPVYRSYLRNHHWGLAAVLLRLGEHAGAAENAREIAGLYPKAWDQAHRAAVLVARAIPLARKDAALPPEKSAEVVRGYADGALQLLRQAVENGLTDPRLLTAEPAFEPLRTREDFQALVTRLGWQKTI